MTTIEENRNKELEQRRGNRLLDMGIFPAIAAFAAVIMFFLYVSLLRAAAPFAFLPAFLSFIVITIFSIAYFMVVMIRKEI